MIDPNLGGSGAPQLQYVEMPYAMSSAAIAASMGGGGGLQSLSLVSPTASSAEHTSLHKPQYHGVKRIMVPHYGEAGAWGGHPGGAGCYGMPPIKIIAGQGGQRIVSRVGGVGGNGELQIIPKPSS